MDYIDKLWCLNIISFFRKLYLVMIYYYLVISVDIYFLIFYLGIFAFIFINEIAPLPSFLVLSLASFCNQGNFPSSSTLKMSYRTSVFSQKLGKNHLYDNLCLVSVLGKRFSGYWFNFWINSYHLYFLEKMKFEHFQIYWHKVVQCTLLWL